MQTVLIIFGAWLLINVLFVIVMTPPRKADLPRSSTSLVPARLEQYTKHYEEEEKASVRLTIIALAMGVFFSLTPPLIEAVDDIKRLINKSRRSGGPGGGDEAGSKGASVPADSDDQKSSWQGSQRR